MRERLSSLSINNNSSTGFPGDPSTPGAGTVGADYHWQNGWLAGGAVTVGYESPSFSLGGNFTQNETMLSLYAGYRRSSWWGDAIGSYGYLGESVNRIVPIGISLQSNTGSTNGFDFSEAFEGGYNFKTGWLTHSPIIGMVLQQVRVNGFTESGSFTSLSFANQTRYSEVNVLGYRASSDWGRWHPYVQAVWDHELDGLNRQVTASLTTISAPSYSMPAVAPGRDWATGTIGTQVKIGRNWTANASFIAQMGQTNVTNYGGNLGMNYAFGADRSAN